MLGVLAWCGGCAGPGGTLVEPTADRFEYARVVMGSKARVVVYAERDPTEAVRRAFEVIDACDRALSDYNPNSESRRLTARSIETWHEVSPLLFETLAIARGAYDASDGAFDVTIGALTTLWREANAEGIKPPEEAIAKARDAVGMSFVAIDSASKRVRLSRDGMRLDFGGIGKGYAADRAIDSLRTDGLPAAIVEIGGDLVAGDPPPGARGWTVRVSDGASPGAALVLANEAAATSGDAYRFYEIDGVRVSHVIEPSTATPARPDDAVTVVARAGWIADAVATVARLRGYEAAVRAGERLGGVRLVKTGGVDPRDADDGPEGR